MQKLKKRSVCHLLQFTLPIVTLLHLVSGHFHSLFLRIVTFAVFQVFFTSFYSIFLKKPVLPSIVLQEKESVFG